MAAVTSPPQFETDPDKGLKVNVNGTYNVLDFARKLECVILEIGLKVLYYNDLRSDTRAYG